VKELNKETELKRELAAGIDEYEKNKYARLSKDADKKLAQLAKKYVDLISRYKSRYEVFRDGFYMKDEKFKANR
jgi:CII-binding regulator of phage lambda lysogenization HflD